MLSCSDTPTISAVNSINVIDSYFEGKLLVGIVATTGSVVRIEGNTIENMGGPAVIANQIGALTVRATHSFTALSHRYLC